MTLPEITGLTSSSPALLRAFAKRLTAIGVSLSSAQPIVDAVRAIPPVLRRPIRAFHLRQRRDPAAFAMRMFLFADPVTRAEALLAMGESLTDLLAIGLLVEDRDGSIGSPFVLSVVDDLFLLSDDLSRGADAVMGFSEGTVELCRAALPDRSLDRILDLGCGSGTGALVLARNVRHAVGVDINPRAVALARINAAINGVANVEFYESDLFAAVAGQSFDLILSQPPFVPKPKGVGDAQFLYGGARGDELALTLMGRLADHLTPKGRAVLFVEWPDTGEPLEARLRAAVAPSELDILVLAMPPTSPDLHAAAYAAGIHTELGRAFEDEALVRRLHFERLGIRALCPTFVVVERAASGPGYTHAVPIEAFAKIEIHSARIDKMIAARAVTASASRLLNARLRMPEGTVLAEEQLGPGAEQPSTLWARFAPQALIPPVQINIELLALFTFVHEGANVRAAVERFAEAMEISLAEAMPRAIEAVEQALLGGLLEIA